MKEYCLDSYKSKEAYKALIDSEWEKNKHLIASHRSGKKVSTQQFNAMHVFIRNVVAELDERGITTTEFFKEGYEVPWSETRFKDEVWKPLQAAIMEDNKSKSTTVK